MLLPARMRVGAGWVDVKICNISSRGLMIRTAYPAPRGTYVEIRRDAHTIVGRAVWQKGDDFGMFTQDRLDVEAIVARPSEPMARRADGQPERRLRLRHEQPGWRDDAAIGRLIQLAGLGGVALGMAILAACIVHELLAQPFGRAADMLAGAS